MYCVQLLIAPEGIEIKFSLIRGQGRRTLLIAPEGIEIVHTKVIRLFSPNF